MFQLLSKKLKNRKGFTLIELIVVLAILGIILAIAVPNYLGVQAKAAEDADARTAQLVEKAVEIWYLQEVTTETAGDTDGFAFELEDGDAIGDVAWTPGVDVKPGAAVQTALEEYLDFPIVLQSFDNLTVTVAAPSPGNPPSITTALTSD